jgi:hypothetical protein
MTKSAKKKTANKTRITKEAAKPRVKASAGYSTTFSLAPERFQSADEVYSQLRICLSRITHFPINEIRQGDDLSSKFHFTSGGLRVLAQNLEACFGQAGYPLPKSIDRDALQKAKTVGDIADILNDIFGF